MKLFVRNYILNFFFFPLLLISTIVAAYLFSLPHVSDELLTFFVVITTAILFLCLICGILILTVGHLNSTLFQVEGIRNQRLIQSLGKATTDKIHNIFLVTGRSSFEQQNNLRKYYIVAVVHVLAAIAIQIVLFRFFINRESTLWLIDSFRLLGIMNAVAFWIVFNIFRKYIERSLQVIKRFSDRCLYYASEDLRRSQIFNTISEVVKIFNDEQSLEPVFKKILGDCIRLLELDVGAMEVFLGEGNTSRRIVVVPTSSAISLDEDFYELVAGRSEVHNNLTLSRLFKPIADQGFSSMLHVTLDIRGGEVGYMAGFTRQQRDLRDADLDFFYTFGRQASMVIENAYLLEKVKLLSVTDGLTGLNNHRYFKESIVAEVRRAVRYNKQLCVVMLDIDHFKHYNDTNGHPAGDRVLQKVARILTDLTRDTDIVARYGGEEFVLVLTETTKAGGVEFANRLCLGIEKEEFENQKSQPGGNLTVSMGVSSCRADSTDPDELIDLADKALYRAKNAGRNRVMAHGQE
jgi:diguanylate cyclase (GGDEF)-like protein